MGVTPPQPPHLPIFKNICTPPRDALSPGILYIIIETLESLESLELSLIGVPSGVKMYSGCFAEDTLAAAEVLAAWINGDLGFSTTEVLDMDEESYRLGEWKIDMFGQAITPASPLWIQGSKHQVQAVGEDEVLESLSEHILEIYEALF